MLRRYRLKLRAAVCRARDVLAEHVARPETPQLAGVRRRVELFVSALYGRPIPIQATPDPPDSPYERLWYAVAQRPIALPSTDGERVQLPAALTRKHTAAAALDIYRLMALQQSERIVRGTRLAMPAGDPLARDLFLLAEGAAIDAIIVSRHPPLAPTVRAERARALKRRPWVAGMTTSERAVEDIIRATLTSAAEVPPVNAPSPEESLAWAQACAGTIRLRSTDYRGLPPVVSWGRVDGDAINPDPRSPDWKREHARPMEHITMRKFSGGRTEANSEAATRKTSDSFDGRSTIEELTDSGASNTNAAPPKWTGAPPPRADRQARPPADASRPLPPPRQDWRLSNDPDAAVLPDPIWFDEWDANSNSYKRAATGVRVYEPAVGGAADAIIAPALRPMIAEARRVLEVRAARRVHESRQTTGDEIDLAAWVEATIERRLGMSPDDRVYRGVRRARRPLAIALLVDASGSTGKLLGDGSRIIDVEKQAMMVAASALDAMGDPYAVFAFAGQTVENVAVVPIKRFHETGGALSRRRMAPVEPRGFTRLGGVVRYATAELIAQQAGHRVLLLVSDGRPNDADGYHGEYGIEDSRRAVLEARAAGVRPFCLTIDQEGAEYLPHVFGPTGYTIVRHPDQLSRAIVHALQRMVGPI